MAHTQIDLRSFRFPRFASILVKVKVITFYFQVPLGFREAFTNPATGIPIPILIHPYGCLSRLGTFRFVQASLCPFEAIQNVSEPKMETP